MFNALAPGRAVVRNLLRGEDALATLAAVRQLGVQVDDRGHELVLDVPESLREPSTIIDCGNSGTTMRVLCGLLASHEFFSVLTGDASLRSRPMRRVVDPLRAMGVRIDGRDDGRRAPLAIRGGEITPPAMDLAIASAQVKTAVLLASLRVGGRVREPRRSRDHSERMLGRMGAVLEVDEQGWIHLGATQRLNPIDVDVPGDVSSAAFFLVGGSIVPESRVTLCGVGMNPTRTGVVDALLAMGAKLDVVPVNEAGPEPMADITVTATRLKGTRIDGELALRALDELPVLAVAAAFADGETVIADASELRVKESDRIARVVEGLRALGVEVEEKPDGMVISGRESLTIPDGAAVNASGDHRIAMAFSIAAVACRSGGLVSVSGAESVTSSYPTFFEQLEALRG